MCLTQNACDLEGLMKVWLIGKLSIYAAVLLYLSSICADLFYSLIYMLMNINIQCMLTLCCCSRGQEPYCAAGLSSLC